MITSYLGSMTDVGNAAALNNAYAGPSLQQAMGINQGGYLRKSVVDVMGAAQQSGSALLNSAQARAAEVAQRMRVNMPQMPGMGMAQVGPGGALGPGQLGPVMPFDPASMEAPAGTVGPSVPASPGGGGSQGGGGGNKGRGGGSQGGGGGNKGGGGKGNPGRRPPTGGSNALMNRNMLLGGATALGGGIGAAPGLMEMQQGNVLGGGVQAAVGGTTGAIGSRMMAGPGGIGKKLGGLALMGAGYLAGGFLGDRAQVAKAEATGATSTEEEAAQKAGRTSREADAKVDLAINQGILNQNLAAIKDLSRFNADLEREYMMKNMPMIEKMKRNELVRNQAMAATLTSNYAMLGAQATAGKLALGAQEQMGANLRTALTNNPYAGNTMQAPNISF